MKKIISAISTIVLSIGLMAGVASAQEESCSITGTGPDSNNVCQFDSKNNVIYTCKNDILVVNGTDQHASSGVTQSTNNTSSGAVSSGNAINENEFTTDINASCGQLAVAPTPQTPASTKETQDKDKPTPAQVTSTPKGGVNAGGETSGINGAMVAGLVASIGALGSGVFLYKKFEL